MTSVASETHSTHSVCDDSIPTLPSMLRYWMVPLHHRHVCFIEWCPLTSRHVCFTEWCPLTSRHVCFTEWCPLTSPPCMFYWMVSPYITAMYVLLNGVPLHHRHVCFTEWCPLHHRHVCFIEWCPLTSPPCVFYWMVSPYITAMCVLLNGVPLHHRHVCFTEFLGHFEDDLIDEVVELQWTGSVCDDMISYLPLPSLLETFYFVAAWPNWRWSEAQWTYSVSDDDFHTYPFHHYFETFYFVALI